MTTRFHTGLALVSLALLAAGCGGPRAFTRGTYEDPNEIEMLDDEFNENDMQLIAKKMVNSMVASPAVVAETNRPSIVVARLKNSTAEHIDMVSIADKVQTALAQSGKFRLLDKAAREDVAQEYEYQQSGYVQQDQAKGPGQQVSADYIVTGEMSQNIQQVGRDKLVYYKMTMKLTNIRTGELAWTDEKEIRKKFKKKAVSW